MDQPKTTKIIRIIVTGYVLFCGIIQAYSQNAGALISTLLAVNYSGAVHSNFFEISRQRLLPLERGKEIVAKKGTPIYEDNHQKGFIENVQNENNGSYKDSVKKVSLWSGLIDFMRFIAKIVAIVLLIPVSIVLFCLWGVFLSLPFLGAHQLSELIRRFYTVSINYIDRVLRKRREARVSLLKNSYPKAYQALCPKNKEEVTTLSNDYLKGLARKTNREWRTLNAKIAREEDLQKKIDKFKQYNKQFPYAISSYFGFSTIPSEETIEKIVSLSYSALKTYNEEGYLLFLILGDDVKFYPPGKLKYRIRRKYNQIKIRGLSNQYPRAFSLWSGGLSPDTLSDRLLYVLSIQGPNRWADVEEQCKAEEAINRRKEAEKRYIEHINKIYDNACAHHPVALNDFFLAANKSLDNALKGRIAVLSDEALSRFDIQGRFLYNISHDTKAEADLIREYLINNGINCFYHFTDQSNIDSIMKNGGLYSWQYCLSNSIGISKPGGGTVSRTLDKRYALEDFVRLSFCSDHPMMKRLEDNGYNLVLLKIKIDVACLAGTQFSDMNATDSMHHHGPSLEDLKRIDLSATKQTFVSRDSGIFKQHQAEVMVKTFVPTEYIIGYD